MIKHFLKQILQNSSGILSLKYYFRWKASLEDGANSIRDEQPWITFKTISFLKNNLSKNSRVFEYGGGGSTLFFVKLVGEVVTVEHNKEWFAILSEMINKKAFSNWKGNFIDAEKGDLISNPNKNNPSHYSSGDKPSVGFNYKKYVSCIDQFSDESFDLVSVDGRSRPSCILHAIPKIKNGGFLLVDNSDRDYYLSFFQERLKREFVNVVDGFGPTPYAKEFTRTSIWQKKIRL